MLADEPVPDPQPKNDVERRLYLKQAGLLWGAAMLGGAAVLPYAFAMQAERLQPYLAKTGRTLWSLGVLSLVQTAVLAAITVLVGLWAARRVGWAAPVSAAVVQGHPVLPIIRRFAGLAILLGLLSGVLLVALDALVFLPRLPALAEMNRQFLHRAPLYYGALACLYGGITEELFLRLLVMSLLAVVFKAALGRRLTSPKSGTLLLWTANVAAALLFALGHLPAAKGLIPFTPLFLIRTLLLNGIVGVLCGWLYARRGLEAAMLAHASADVILHVLAPALALWGILHL